MFHSSKALAIIYNGFSDIATKKGFIGKVK